MKRARHEGASTMRSRSVRREEQGTPGTERRSGCQVPGWVCGAHSLMGAELLLWGKGRILETERGCLHRSANVINGPELYA